MLDTLQHLAFAVSILRYPVYKRTETIVHIHPLLKAETVVKWESTAERQTYFCVQLTKISNRKIQIKGAVKVRTAQKNLEVQKNVGVSES
jgi:hypothetical protein